MVFKISWTLKALQTYVDNMQYLQTAWTEKEVNNFAITVEKKLTLLSKQPGIGAPRNISNKTSGIYCYTKGLL